MLHFQLTLSYHKWKVAGTLKWPAWPGKVDGVGCAVPAELSEFCVVAQPFIERCILGREFCPGRAELAKNWWRQLGNAVQVEFVEVMWVCGNRCPRNNTARIKNSDLEEVKGEAVDGWLKVILFIVAYGRDLGCQRVSPGLTSEEGGVGWGNCIFCRNRRWRDRRVCQCRPCHRRGCMLPSRVHSQDCSVKDWVVHMLW
jgi:hypothetical protein